MGENTMEAVKKYWPWALGALALLWLMNRNAASSSGDGGAAFYASQNAASLQNAQLGMQQAAMNAQIDKQAQEYSLQSKALDAQTNVAYLNAQANMAKAVGESAGATVNALYAPAITAMQAGAIENSAALNAAATVAVGGFKSQSDMVAASNNIVSGAASGLNSWSGAWQGLAGFLGAAPVKGTGSQIAEIGAQAAATYYTGGMYGGYGRYPQYF